jgi:hypothetical protein
VRTNRLGLGHGGLHTIFYQDGRDQVAQKGAPVAGIASELESCIAMAHNKTLQKQLSALSCQLSALLLPHVQLKKLRSLIVEVASG